jgi:hypothetical protein
MPENDEAPENDSALNDLLMRPTRPEEAREQAAECLGFIRGRTFDLGDGQTWELPNPSLLDDEQQPRYNEYLFEIQNLDRYPDDKDDDGNVIRRGDIMDPPQKDGELLEPNDIRLAKALMGDDIYAKFIKAGGRSSQLRVHWSEMNRRMMNRLRDDSKSNSGAVVGAAVPDRD